MLQVFIFESVLQRTGKPCTYSFPPTTASPTNKCIAAAFAKIGSSAAAVIAPLTNVGSGSRNIRFSGAPDDVNRALAGIAYKTVPYYSQLFRPPAIDQGPLFDITQDSSDSLVVLVDDLGNSGQFQHLCAHSTPAVSEGGVYFGCQEVSFETRKQLNRNFLFFLQLSMILQASISR